MTSPTEEHAHEDPLRLQPVVARSEGWSGRSINLIAVGLVGFVMVGIVLGTTLDNGAPSSSAAAVVPGAPSPSPSATRRPRITTEPLATPLPTREVNGTELPSERRLVLGNGHQILDLGTGTVRSFGRQYEDVLWPIGDELVCICLVRFPTASLAPLLEFRRFRLDGTPIVARELVSLEDVVPVPEMTEGFNMTAAIDTAGGRLVLVDVVRRPPNWVVELHVVDARAGDLLDSTVVDTFPVDIEEPQRGASPSPRTDGGPPDGVYAWANTVSLSPDGGLAFVTVAQSEVRGDVWIGRNLEWLVPIVDDRADQPTALSADASLATDRWCVGRPKFLDSSLIVQLCGPPSQLFDSSFWSVRRLTADGASLGDLPIGAARSDGSPSATMIIDRARRSVVMWDAFRHLVSRVDVDSGRVHAGVVAESMLPGDRRPSGRGWIGVEPGLVASSDGTRLYALGLSSGPGNVGTSTGVWVFDAETLELLDHWAPRALLTSLAVSADGRFVYATSAAGYDVDGRENQRWRSSVSVYDATTGQIVVLYGSIGEGQWLSFQPSL
jgi:DNA-binding beta-propeller fold protein YncE